MCSRAVRTWRCTGALLLTCAAVRLAAAAPVVFARDLALSPDGRTLAFAWAGDIWTVPTTGGAATRLTSNPADDDHPAWSRDGRYIAFASNRHGSANVFTMRADGSEVARLTFADRNEVPSDWSPDGQWVYFHSAREQDPYRETRLFRVPASGGQSWRAVDCFGADARCSLDGKLLAFTRGTSEWWRRGYRGSGNHDLWLWTAPTGEFRQLTDFDGTDRLPFWDGAGRGLYFLSDRGGTVNVWYQPADGGPAEAVTQLAGADVRDLAVSADGRTLAFTHWDQLYILATDTKRARAIEVSAGDDQPQNDAELRTFTKDVSEQEPSPDGKQIALVIHGEIYVIQTEENRLTRRVTNSVAREQDVTWSPDGKAVFFVSDEAGQEDIYRAVSAEEPPKALCDSLRFRCERVTDDPAPEVRPQVSPDGKKLAFLRERGDLMVRDLKTGEEKRLVGRWDRGPYRWSPDGKWIAYQAEDAENNADIWLVPADGSQPPVNVSQYPGYDGDPQWSADGQMLAFASRRDGFDTNLYLVFLSRQRDEMSPVELDVYFKERSEAAKKFKPPKSVPASGKICLPGSAAESRPASQPATSAPHDSNESGAAESQPSANLAASARRWLKSFLEEPRASTKGKEKDKDEEKDGEQESADGRSKAKSLPYELETCYQRIRRVTRLPGDQREFVLSPDGALLAFKSSHEGESRLFTVKWNGEDQKRIVSAAVGGLSWLPDGKKLFFLKGGAPNSCTPSGGDAAEHKLRAKMTIDRVAEAAQKFDDGARQIGLWFYHPTMKGLDWPALTRQYKDLALRTRTVTEFNDVFDMLLGELNGSHLGIFGPGGGSREPLGYIGCTFDRQYAGPGLKVASVLPRGPADREDSRLVPGDVVLQVNGQPVGPDAAIERALIDTAGEEVIIQYQPSPQRKSSGSSVASQPTTDMTPGDAEDESPADEAESAPATSEPATSEPATSEPAASQPTDDPNRPGELVIRPVSQGTYSMLQYDAWVEANRKYIEDRSGGRLGYLHIRGMDEDSFRVFERDLYAAARGRDGLVIDVRNNGGGWTADWVLAVLSVQRHAYTVERGGQPGYPQDRLIFYAWTRPASMLCNQHSFSNAEIVSHAFKTLKRGPLVGVTTYGGVISTGAYTLSDGAMVRVPSRGWYVLPDGVDMECHGAEPDVKVPQTPLDEVQGNEPQLDAAIRATLEQVEQATSKPAMR